MQIKTVDKSLTQEHDYNCEGLIGSYNMLNRTALITQSKRTIFFSSQLRKLAILSACLQSPINVNLNRAHHLSWRAFSGGETTMADMLGKKSQDSEKKQLDVDASRMEASAIQAVVRDTYGRYAQESQAAGLFPSGGASGSCCCSSKKKPTTGSCSGPQVSPYFVPSF
jgi:hypothetical protein